MTDDTLERLAAQAVAGDRESLGRLCAALQGRIYGLALRMLGHPQDAEDASQEILVLIATHLSQFRGRSRLSTWAYKIAVRHLVRFRKSRAEMAATEVQAIAQAIDLGLAATAPEAQPEGDARLLEEEVRLTCTQAMLLCLSRHERIAYLLGQVLGADDRTAAQICGISAAAFRQRLSRARRVLEPLLAERCGLAREANPCSCRRQAAAKQLLGPMKIRLATLSRDAGDVTRANDQLRVLNRAGRVFAINPPLAAPETLWRPDLRGRPRPDPLRSFLAEPIRRSSAASYGRAAGLVDAPGRRVVGAKGEYPVRPPYLPLSPTRTATPRAWPSATQGRSQGPVGCPAASTGWRPRCQRRRHAGQWDICRQPHSHVSVPGGVV